MTVDRWWLADPTIWGRLMATDHEIVEAMLKYGGSFVFSLAQCYRRADAENQAILKTAFAHVWREYAEIARLGKDI